VAAAAGITLNRYQKYEYEILDISKATASTVLHIAQTLGVTAEELLQQKEPEA
jgi:transcriptional regulator with XRE-family HTH domain